MHISASLKCLAFLITPIWAKSSLLPLTFDPLPLGSIKPLGWFHSQLRLMASGLPGHQAEFYRYVKDSTWTGGNEEYSALNEAWPYWFNAIVPLAYSLDDLRLKSQVHAAVDYLFEHQHADGWLGPESTPQTRFLASRSWVLLGLTQYLEAEPERAPELLPKIYAYMELTKAMLEDDYLGFLGRDDSKFDYHWGITRSHETILSLQWLYDHHPSGNEELLLGLMRLYNEKAWDWAWFYAEENFPKDDPTLVEEDDKFWFFHGVNSAMGMKAGAVVRRFTGNESLVAISKRGVEWTFQYHGSVAGSILGDEPWVDLSPTRGSELCTTVETMFSLDYLFRAFGVGKYADMAELAAFNALPAAVTPDHWAHQYVTQTNQPFSYNLTESPFNNVNSAGATFGLEPDYPCCTVNHPQGFPKFLSSAYVKTSSTGIGHVHLLPSELQYTLSDNNLIRITCTTSYPFTHDLHYTITAHAPFTFSIRIPDWALSSSSISINSRSPIPLSSDPESGFHSVPIPAGTSTLRLTLDAELVIQSRANDSVAISHGALIYALPIASLSSSRAPHAFRDDSLLPDKWTHPQANDWEFHNATQWNIAIDPTTLKFARGEVKEGENPLAEGAMTSWVEVAGCEIAWGTERKGGSAARVPLKGERECRREWKGIMVPYGSSRLHMAELPVIDLEQRVEL